MRIVAGELKGRRLIPPRRSEAVSSDRRPRPRGAVLDPRAGRGGAPSWTSSAGPGRWRSRRSRAEPNGPHWSTAAPRWRAETSRALGVSGRCEVVRGDAIRYLRRARRRFDLIFCDPPYRLADRLEGELDSLIGARLAEGGRLITESATRRPLSLGLPLLTERRYGDTMIRIHEGAAG